MPFIEANINMETALLVEGRPVPPQGQEPSAFLTKGQMQKAEIVGVVASIRHDGLDLPPRQEIFIPHSQNPFGSMTLVARSDGDPAALIDGLKAQIYEVDRLQTIYRIATAKELVSKSLIERRSSSR